MSVSVVQRLFAFFGNVWSFILTLVRSLLALFFFRRRASDPLTLPGVNRTPKEAFARAHSRLRPILLTPRSIALSPAIYAQRAQSTRTRSATSTLVPDASGSAPPASAPQRTSPKLDPQDPELGFSITVSVPGSSAASLPGGTPDTSSQTTNTGSLSVLPLTPPDRCYLTPSSPTDCPYLEPWPINAGGKLRLPGSPLKMSINVDPAFAGTMVVPIGSPPPGRWSPVQVWTSTPYKNDNIVPEPVLSPFDHHTGSTLDPSSALANISHALISRSRSSIHPYDDASNSSTSSDASLFVNFPNGPIPATLQQADSIRERCRTQVQMARSKNQLYPQFHHPNAYACAWRRHGARVPGKPNHATRTHASYSHMDLPSSRWYDEDAYAPSPIPVLSPPLGDSATEDEDEVPLSRLRARLVRRSVAVSPRTRRKSEGCLLGISESPTRIGVGARSGTNMLSLAFDGDNSPKDWLEALSLRFPSEQKEAMRPAPEPCSALP